MKKLSISGLLILLFPIFIYSQNLYNAIYNGDINYLQNYINRQDVNHYSLNNFFEFSNNDLRILRNTIYAMHGYIFRSKDLQDHFNKFEWYNGTKENVENELSENELRLIRIIAATEAANPPARNDLIGHWVYPVPVSVENIGYIHYYLRSDGRIEGHNMNGYWSLEGTTFRTIPDDRNDYQAESPFNWSEEVKNLRFIIFEYNGQLYRVCNFFNGDFYESSFPLEYWIHPKNKKAKRHIQPERYGLYRTPLCKYFLSYIYENILLNHINHPKIPPLWGGGLLQAARKEKN